MMEVRKPTRLKDYDYSQDGGYFITFCTKERKPVLGKVVVGGGACDAPHIRLSDWGRRVENRIHDMGERYPDVRVEMYVVMPNHVHLLLLVQNGTSQAPSPTNATIPKWVSLFKRFTNRDCGVQLWQRGFYDHILRDENGFLRHWEYIDQNPGKWAEDKYHI